MYVITPLPHLFVRWLCTRRLSYVRDIDVRVYLPPLYVSQGLDDVPLLVHTETQFCET